MVFKFNLRNYNKNLIHITFLQKKVTNNCHMREHIALVENLIYSKCKDLSHYQTSAFTIIDYFYTQKTAPWSFATSLYSTSRTTRKASWTFLVAST